MVEFISAVTSNACRQLKHWLTCIPLAPNLSVVDIRSLFLDFSMYQICLFAWSRFPFCSNTSSFGHMTSPSQMSSSTESPGNSRTSSPALTAQQQPAGVMPPTNQSSPGMRSKGLSAPSSLHSMGSVDLWLPQLLQILKVDWMLSKFSVKQVK